MLPTVRLLILAGVLYSPIVSFGAPHVVKVMDGRVSVKFPAPAKKSTRKIKASYGDISFESYKSQTSGVFMNLLITKFPAAIGERAQKNQRVFLERMATGNEKQKNGARRIYFRDLKGSKHRGTEHRFTYPTGKNSTGAKYAAGFAIYRYYLVDGNLVTVFVDVVNGLYNSRGKAIDEETKEFFASLKIGAK